MNDKSFPELSNDDFFKQNVGFDDTLIVTNIHQSIVNHLLKIDDSISNDNISLCKHLPFLIHDENNITFYILAKNESGGHYKKYHINIKNLNNE